MKEKIYRALFLFCAIVSIFIVVFIAIFIFSSGIPAIKEIGLWNFLSGKKWKPSENIYGILPMIVGSLYVTAFSLLIAVPVGIFTSVFITYYAGEKLKKALNNIISLASAIPSVLYGFFALMVIVPLVRDLFGGRGMGILSASLLLSIMILPTIVSLTTSSLESLPRELYENSLALGEGKEGTIFRLMLPSSKSGIFSSVTLALGRAIGETMAVKMVVGNQAVLPESILSGVRTLTTNIVLEMGYAVDLHRGALLATAVVLFVFILIINISLSLFKRRDIK